MFGGWAFGVVRIDIPSLPSVSRSMVSYGCRLRDDWQRFHRRSFRRALSTDLELFFGEPVGQRSSAQDLER
jgi:hypothetical protein